MLQRHERTRIMRRSLPAPAASLACANQLHGATLAPTPADAAMPTTTRRFDFNTIFILPTTPSVGPQGGDLEADVTHQIRAQRGGAALDRATRTRMEANFGHNFADVRVHAGGAADGLNRQVGANAFTVGSNIFLSQEAQQSGAYGGDRLLAHELAHVVQQRGARQDGLLSVTAVNDPSECEASTVADATRASSDRGGVNMLPGGPASVATVRVQRDGEKPGPTDATASAHAKHADKVVAPKPTLTSLSTQVEALKKQQKAVQLDLEWRAKFGQKMASYKQTVWRITGGIDAANKGFQDAQVAQSQTDQMWTQFFSLVAAVAFAGGFEFLATKGLGAVGRTASKISGDVEKLENPANALLGGLVTNVLPPYLQGKRAEKAQAPAAAGGGGGALAFLASQSEELEQHSGAIEGAFSARAQQMKALTDEQWAAFDVDAQATTYDSLFKELEGAGKGIEDLRTPEQVAAIIELHLWAAWIKGQHSIANTLSAMLKGTKAEDEGQENPNALGNFGSDINERLIFLGVEAAAHTGLYTHWWERNADDWARNIMNWARAYTRSVAAR